MIRRCKKAEKCLLTVSGKHVWEPLQINSSFTGTVGYYLTYVLKCAACSIVDDTDRITVPDYTTGWAILGQLVGIKECRSLGKHKWKRLDESSVPSQEAICERCRKIKFRKHD